MRTYYPIEFIAAYLNRAENSDDTNFGIELARMYNVDIKPIQFGKSLAEYAIDKENRAIYKGIASIKYCNSIIAEELMNLAKEKHYKSFIELLDDINEKTSVNNRQLNILTGLNFFSEYGANKYLLQVLDLYNGIEVKDPKTKKAIKLLPSIRTCKQIKKDKLEAYAQYGLTEYLLKKYSGKETEKQYSQIDNVGLLNEMISRLENKSMSIIEYVKFEKEYLQYVTYTNPKVADYYYIVVDYKTFKDQTKPHFVLRNIKTGEEVKSRIKQGEIYKQNPFGEFAVLKIEGFTMEYKKKLINGEWKPTEELEPILECYEVIKNE